MLFRLYLWLRFRRNTKLRLTWISQQERTRRYVR